MKIRLLSLLAVVTITTASFGSLVGYWDFSGSAGATTVADLAGSNDATIMGGASLDGSGKVSLAGGQSGEYVDLGASLGSTLAGMTSFTIASTVDWDGAASGTYQKMWNFSQAGTTEFSTLTFVSSNEAYIRYQHRYAAHDDKTSVGTPDLKGKHQVTLRYDASLGSYGQAKIFIDGVEEGGHTCDADNSLAISGASVNNWLGKSAYDGGNYFDGAFYDFRIFDKALTDAEVAQLAIPEPTTIALLGLGVLGLIRRKK
jgi:hypothetical protein